MTPQDGTATGDRYDHRVTVAHHDIDANDHANNVSYVRWIQEAAVAHWLAVVDPGLTDGLSWVVVRHEIDYKKPARCAEELVVRTWVGEITAATTVRFCEIRRRVDGELLARSRTVWCALDARTGRPKRIGPEIRALFFGRLPPPTEEPVTPRPGR